LELEKECQGTRFTRTLTYGAVCPPQAACRLLKANKNLYMVDGLQGINFSYASNANLVAHPPEGMFELDGLVRYILHPWYASFEFVKIYAFYNNGWRSDLQ
jgi:hypothetical protein